ncbi:matrix-remodeling-associated protein 8-like [Poecilia latipinna]|uniref:matrix-remodeling-associated protein 8-like n=1 Tax=Poecilia latipinna TaxID=48699 RepID=UPI00072E6144|nr:PREDICTED: matrix-remodeling-associated protein 8-like [Poecilia latipinna]
MVKVEVQEGAESVVLPCQYNQVLEEIVTVKWSRRDLNPSIVHQRREGDDLQSQNQLFSGRTSMRSDALDSGNFSLILSKVQLSDIGNYICSLIDEEEEKTLSEVELQLKASQDSLTKKVEVQWVQSVVLPCQYSQPLEEMVTVKWRRLDLKPDIVHQRREGDNLESQNEIFKGRTSMRADAFDSGDFSLTLSELQLSDNGNYTCSMIDEEEKETTLSEVHLLVKGQ